MLSGKFIKDKTLGDVYFQKVDTFFKRLFGTFFVLDAMGDNLHYINDSRKWGFFDRMRVAMASCERYYSEQKEKSVVKSRLFRGGTVAALVGAGLGIGFLVEVGAVAAVGGAGWTWAFGNPKSK